MLCLFIPLIVLIILSSAIIIRLIRGRKTQRRLTTNQANNNERERKVTINVLSIVLAFIILYIPDTVLGLIHLNSTKINEQIVEVTEYYGRIPKLMNCIIDTFVFVIVSSKFRSILKALVRCKCKPQTM